MSWVKGALPGILALTLSACGFSPLYADHAEGTDESLAAVSVDQISDHLGVVLTDRLRDGFNPTGLDVPIAYQLHVTLSEESTGLAYRNDGTIAQTQVDVTGTWTLRRLSDKKLIANGTSLGTTFYDDMPDAYANTEAKDTGEMRAVQGLADDIHARVTLLLKNGATAS